jgi:hypothetical protein
MSNTNSDTKMFIGSFMNSISELLFIKLLVIILFSFLKLGCVNYKVMEKTTHNSEDMAPL